MLNTFIAKNIKDATPATNMIIPNILLPERHQNCPVKNAQKAAKKSKLPSISICAIRVEKTHTTADITAREFILLTLLNTLTPFLIV